MKKIVFLFSMLILNIYFVSGQWNSIGDNTTTGNLTIGSMNSLITINGSTSQAFGSIGKLDFYNGNSNSNVIAARIEGKRDQHTHKDGRLSFYTADDNGSLKERLIIDRHGHLRFNGSTSQAYGSLGRLDFYNGNSNSNVIAARVEGKRDRHTHKDGRLSFYTADDNGSLKERLIIDRHGRLRFNGSTSQAYGSLGKLDFYNGNSNSNVIAARIEGKRDQHTHKDGRLSFYTADDNGSLKENMILSRKGNLAIKGKLEAKEIKVTLSPTADFVFEPDYNLPALSDIETYIKENKHLPEIASASEMKENGLNISEFQIQLLQKIEELTLYTIEQQKKIVVLEKQNLRINELEKQNQEILELLEALR